MLFGPRGHCAAEPRREREAEGSWNRGFEGTRKSGSGLPEWPARATLHTWALAPCPPPRRTKGESAIHNGQSPIECPAHHDTAQAGTRW